MMIETSNKHDYKTDLTYTYMILRIFISDSNMKTPDEAALTLAIIEHQNFLTFYEKMDSHNSEEEKKFNNVKRKMLTWISKIDTRMQRVYPIDDTYVSIYTPLYEELNALKHVPANSMTALLREKQKIYQNIYESAGYAKTRAEKISKELIAFLKRIEEMKGQNVTDIDSEYNELSSIVKTENKDKSYYREKLQSPYKNELLVVGEDNDTYASINLKFFALKALLTDEFIQQGNELYRVHASEDDYPVSLDLWGCSLEDFINEEKSIFQKHGKTLTAQHINKIHSVHTKINKLEV